MTPIKKSRLNSILGLAIVILGLVFSGLLVTAYLNDAHNSLVENGNWTPTQLIHEVQDPSANQFFVSRASLARNRLNLSAWGGHHEVVYNRAMQPKSVTFDFELGANSWLVFTFNRSASGYEGLRLSTDANLPSIYFKASPAGEFSQVKKIPTKIVPTKLTEAQLALDDGWLSVRLGGKELGRFETYFNYDRFIGFRGGDQTAWVSHLRAIGLDDQLIVEESFKREDIGAKTFLFILGGLGLGVLLISLVLAIIRRRPVLPVLLGVQLVVSVLVLGLWAADQFFWQHQEFKNGRNQVPEWLNAGENIRTDLFGVPTDLGIGLAVIPENRDTDFLLKALRDDVSSGHRSLTSPLFVNHQGQHFELDQGFKNLPPKEPKTLRILMMGGSLGVGLGADDVSQGIAPQLVQKIKEQVSERPVDVVAVPSVQLGLKELFAKYKKSMGNAQIDMMIVTPTFSFDGEENFENLVLDLIQYNNSKGIETCFLLDPSGLSTPYTEKLTGILKVAATRKNIPVWNPRDLLGSKEAQSKGFLWRSGTNLSSFGYKITAKWLGSNLEPYVKHFRPNTH